MAGSDDRCNFSSKTKYAIASAVNWQCSAPLCTNPAMGADDGALINGGTACHIFSAAKNGPRGRGGLSDEQLEDASNGLWCCANHGRVIDANQGTSFPAAQLHMWKRLAEGRVRRAMAVQFAELGWIHRFSLSVDTRFGRRWEVTATLQKNNLLRGNSGAGKSLLLEALASISENRHAWRLRRFPKFSVDISYETLTRETVAQASCEQDEPIRRRQGGMETSLAPPDMVVLYLAPEPNKHIKDRTGIGYLTKILGIEEDVLFGLARSVSSNPNSGMSVTLVPMENDESDSTNEVDESHHVIFVKFDNRPHEFTFNSLSSSEQVRVAGALLIALAREEVRTRPVLLCIDSLWQLDDRAIRYELSKLAEEHIQLLVVAPYVVIDSESLGSLPGWNLLEMPSIEDSLRQS